MCLTCPRTWIQARQELEKRARKKCPRNEGYAGRAANFFLLPWLYYTCTHAEAHEEASTGCMVLVGGGSVQANTCSTMSFFWCSSRRKGIKALRGLQSSDLFVRCTNQRTRLGGPGNQMGGI